MEIVKALLGDLITTRKGFAFKSEWYTPSGHPIVKVSNFTDDSVDISNLVCIPEHIAENYISYELKTDDIVIQTVGSWPNNPQSVVGKAVRIPARASGALLNQNAVKLMPNMQVDRSFLYYSLRSSHFAEYIIGTAQGAANQASIALAAIRGFQLSLPAIHLQRKIGNILRIYDDLIENNTRRIQILEEMAQALYREWFVHFRFPGHEQSKMVETAMGMIPEGWTFTTVGAASAYVGRGISPSYNDDAKGIVINQKCIRDGRLDLTFARRQNKPFSADRKVRFGDVLINSTGIGTLGRVAQVYQEVDNCTVDSHVTIARPSSAINTDYFGFQLLAMQTHFDSLGVGSTGQTELARERVAASPILLPPCELQIAFSDAVMPTRKMVTRLFQKNTNLRQTRDLLLPKLISGEVDVADLEIARNVGEK